MGALRPPRSRGRAGCARATGWRRDASRAPARPATACAPTADGGSRGGSAARVALAATRPMLLPLHHHQCVSQDAPRQSSDQRLPPTRPGTYVYEAHRRPSRLSRLMSRRALPLMRSRPRPWPLPTRTQCAHRSTGAGVGATARDSGSRWRPWPPSIVLVRAARWCAELFQPPTACRRSAPIWNLL